MTGPRSPLLFTRPRRSDDHGQIGHRGSSSAEHPTPSNENPDNISQNTLSRPLSFPPFLPSFNSPLSPCNLDRGGGGGWGKRRLVFYLAPVESCLFVLENDENYIYGGDGDDTTLALASPLGYLLRTLGYPNRIEENGKTAHNHNDPRWIERVRWRFMGDVDEEKQKATGAFLRREKFSERKRRSGKVFCCWDDWLKPQSEMRTYS